MYTQLCTYIYMVHIPTLAENRNEFGGYKLWLAAKSSQA